jgi:hypothetical protein
VKGLKKRECPSCRQFNFNTKPNILARRMICSLPCDCPNQCGHKTNIGNLDDHLKKCPKRVHTCGGVEECKFEGIRDDFLKHVVETHGQAVIN